MFGFLSRKPVSVSLDFKPVQAVLFDLDGTLIDVDMSVFVPAYLRRLAEHLAEQADPRRVTHALYGAVSHMLQGTDGGQTLEMLLQERLESEVGLSWPAYQSALDRFCENDLADLRPLVKPHPLARPLVEACVQQGWRVVLATNPIFPRPIVDARLVWGGLADLPFTPVTSYENSLHCKPHRGFFDDLLAQLELPAQSCLMIGNDTLHDMSAGQFGLATCLLTTWRIDRPGGSFPADWEGTHEALLDCLQAVSSTPQND